MGEERGKFWAHHGSLIPTVLGIGAVSVVVDRPIIHMMCMSSPLLVFLWLCVQGPSLHLLLLLLMLLCLWTVSRYLMPRTQRLLILTASLPL